MAKAKSPRIKSKAEKTLLQMPEAPGNGNGKRFSPDLESEIRVRAYELYQERRYTGGRPEEDWFQAEREVLARHGQAHTA